MYAGRRIAALRVTALAALAVSAILYADSLHPGRAFCPMAAACDKARSSALGKIFGVPTSISTAASPAIASTSRPSPFVSGSNPSENDRATTDPA